MNIVKNIEKSIENMNSCNIQNDLCVLEKGIKKGQSIGKITDRLKKIIITQNPKVNKL